MEKIDDITLRRLQLAELDILREVKRICDKHQITYFLCQGTLLGAVRYKKFIPWDDDVDISMPWKEYCRFTEFAQEELPDTMFMETIDSDDTHIEPYGKVRLVNTTFVQDGYNPYGRNNGIWLDIFPIVYVKSQEDWNRKCFLLKLSSCCNCREYVRNNTELFSNAYGKFPAFLLRLFIRTPYGFRKWLRKLIVNPIFNAKETEWVAEVHPWSSMIYPSLDYVSESSQVEFEGELFSTVAQPGKYLRIRYGNYLTPPPEEERYAHKPLMIDFEHGYNEND